MSEDICDECIHIVCKIVYNSNSKKNNKCKDFHSHKEFSELMSISINDGIEEIINE